MILAILAAWFGYKKGKDSGRNGILWAFICAATFIGTQLLTAVVIGMFLGIGVELWGWSEDIYDRYVLLINIACIVISVVSLLLVFRYLDKVPDQEVFTPPPPPTDFS
jgi:MFS family permease